MRRASRQEPEEAQRRVPSDPDGYATGTRISDRDKTQVLSEQKLRRVMNRTHVQNRKSGSTDQSDDVILRKRDQRDNIWNSFTGSYHGGDPNSRRSDTRNDEQQSVRQHTENGYRQENGYYDNGSDAHQYNDENALPYPQRTRRVKFAEKLEVDTKVIPETPRTPTLSILRKRRTSHNSSDNDILPPRDPTPQARVDPIEEREPIRDPPVDSSKNPVVSPGNLPPRGGRQVRSAEKLNNPFFSPMNRFPSSIPLDDNRRVRSAEPQAKQRYMEPSAASPSIAVSPRSDLWSVVDMLRRNNKNAPETPTNEPTPTNLHSSDSYTDSPLSDIMTSESNSPSTPRQLPLSWKMDCPSPSEASTESQTSYLINKYGGRYSGRSKVLMAARSLVRAAGAVSASGGVGGPNPGSTMASGLVVKGEGAGTGSKKASKPVGYSHLQEASDEVHGTELVLLPEKPEPIGFGVDVPTPTKAVHGDQAKRRLSHQNSRGPLLEDNGLANSYDIENIGMPSTSDTDDSDSGIFYNWRGSDWDTFEAKSEDGVKDHVQLIPSRGPNRSKKRLRIFLLLLMVISGLVLAAAIHFKLGIKPSEITVFPIDSSPCVTNNIVSSERFIHIRKLLIDALEGDISMLDVTNTPQRKALCWISDVDERQLSVVEEAAAALVQRYTLAVLYFSLVKEATQDPAGLKNTDFLSSEHECDWEVIMCDGEETVTALLLADKMLAGKLPDEIGNLKNLSFLELSLNKLSGSVPSSIGRLSMLEYFGMAFNTLTGSLPSELGETTKLEFINMRSSQVIGPIPSELGRLSNLETLILEGNWLSGSLPKELSYLHKAEQMSFRRNYLSGSVAPEICELRNGSLTELEVDSWVGCDCCTS